MDGLADFLGRKKTQATSVVSESERLLSKLGHGYKRAKAQQILRLLKDQESLNQRFRDCALDDEDEDDDDENGAGSDGQDSVAGNVGDAAATAGERRSMMRKSNTSETPRRVSSNVDPSRCRTSMGFYNEAECSGSVDGDDLDDIDDFEAETDAAILEDREAMRGRLSGGNRFESRRLFRLQLDDPDTIPEESTIQSARSSRPKTGIASSSARSKQYRRPSQTTDPSSVRKNQNSTISTSVSKLESPITPRGGGIRGFCENPQDGMLQLTPRFSDMSGSFTPRFDPDTTFTPRGYDAVHSRRAYNDIPSYLTPRPNESKPSLTPRQNETPRHNDLAITPRSTNQHRALLNIYNSQITPREDNMTQYVTTPRHDISKSKRQGANGNSTLSTGGRMPLTPRSMLSVDQSPIHVIPTGVQEGEITTPRRQKAEAKTKKRADLQRTGAHKNLSKLSERVHPINVMKLPPLEVAISKPVIY